jgi:hypothetical protein
MSPDYMPMGYIPVPYLPAENKSPEYTHYEVSTPLGTMLVPAPPEPSAEIRQDRGSPPAPSAEIRQDRGSPPANDQVKLFIPHDAIHLEDSQAHAGRKTTERKTFSAMCHGSFYNGPNLVVKLSFPVAHNAQEQSSIEIIADPRTKVPASGSMVDLLVDERLLRFVRADN